VDNDVEVIVVPNGRDDSWKAVASIYAYDGRVRWHSIEVANANSARNHGLRLARGKYIRFLDDDDYLTDRATEQCIDLEISNCDVSQGGIDFVDSTGITFHSRKVYATKDFLIAILAPDIFTLPHSLLWRRELLTERRWDPDRKIGQDVAFAFGVAREQDVSVHQCQFQVGAWLHHAGQRISGSADHYAHGKTQAEILLNAVLVLQGRSALTAQRREWLSKNLWRLIHSHFPLSPIFWNKMANVCLELAPGSRPEERAFGRFPFAYASPLVIEWLFTPHRLVRHHVRERFGMGTPTRRHFIK
jgi:glycosyltransferase involved in cell wall biosynthesis